MKFINHDFEFNNEKDAMDLKELVEKEFKVNALVIETDVSNEFEVKECISKIIDTYGRIDVVVNCAGIVFDRDMYKATVAEFKNTIKVNVMGAFIVSREASRNMNKGGSIINISSTNGTKVIAPESIVKDASLFCTANKEEYIRTGVIIKECQMSYDDYLNFCMRIISRLI